MAPDYPLTDRLERWSQGSAPLRLPQWTGDWPARLKRHTISSPTELVLWRATDPRPRRSPPTGALEDDRRNVEPVWQVPIVNATAGRVKMG